MSSSITIRGWGTYESVYATRNLTDEIIMPPHGWDEDTIMYAKLDGDLKAGSIDSLWQNVDGFKLKRRNVGEYDWLTLKYFARNESLSPSSFSYIDNTVPNNTEVEYAIVPIKDGVEQEYVIRTVTSKFNKIYICDATEIYSFSAGFSYGDENRVQKVGVFEPYGRKYPVVVSNGNISYSTGSISTTVLPDNYMETRELDRSAIIMKRKQLNDFLTNKKAKILKDWNGNAWLIFITGNPIISYDSNSGMLLPQISAEWTEIGDPLKQSDLINAGIIPEV